MKNLILTASILVATMACKKTEVRPVTPKGSATINGKTINTNNTSPTATGYYVTVYYDSIAHLTTLNIKDADTKDDIDLLIYSATNLSDISSTLNTLKYQAYYFPGSNPGLMNKNVTGNLTIKKLIIQHNKVSSFSANFSFKQTSNDVFGTDYVHNIENASINDLKQTE